jgi:hypothetical protein
MSKHKTVTILFVLIIIVLAGLLAARFFGIDLEIIKPVSDISENIEKEIPITSKDTPASEEITKSISAPTQPENKQTIPSELNDPDLEPEVESPQSQFQPEPQMLQNLTAPEGEAETISDEELPDSDVLNSLTAPGT